MMARLEDSEAGNAPAARDWLARAVGAPPDPCHVCTRCGGETPEWQALCPQCSGFDTLVWRRPPAGSRPVITHRAADGALLMLPSPDVPGEGDPPRHPASRLAQPPRWDK